MTLGELIGSSLMLGIRGSSLDQDHTRHDVDVLKAVHCKGVILFDHDIAGNHQRNIVSPEQLTAFIADLRHELGDDLVVAIDQEGGQVSRLKQEHGFLLPSASAAELGTYDEMDLRQHAQRQALKLKALGIDINLAPCVDLSIEPCSPIIAEKDRAFGDDHDTVVRCASTMIEIYQHEKLGCCIKHFPGHGSSLIDSHNGMCDITLTHSPQEQRVFASLIERFGDALAIMPGHLVHRDVDAHLPASLSPAHLQGVLRGSLGFDGLIISDSLDMRAVRDGFGEEDAAVLALMAGCDIVIDGFNAPGYRAPGGVVRMVNAISSAIRSGRWPDGEARLAQSRARLDRAYWRSTPR